MFYHLMEKLEMISDRLKEHLHQTRLLSQEAQTILNQVEESIEEMRQNSKRDPAGYELYASINNAADLQPVDTVDMCISSPTNDVKGSGAVVVAAPAAELIVPAESKCGEAKCGEAKRLAAKRKAEDQPGPEKAKFCKPEHSDFFNLLGTLQQYHSEALCFLGLIEKGLRDTQHMKNYYTAVNHFNRNKHYMLLYKEKYGFPEGTMEHTKMLLGKNFDLFI